LSAHPTPGAGEVLVRVRADGLNGADMVHGHCTHASFTLVSSSSVSPGTL
jgi:NADPH:quinone reductase-like Zn-dependent oxidoreductase